MTWESSSGIGDEVKPCLRPLLELPLLAYRRSIGLLLIVVLVLDFLRTVSLFVAGTEMMDVVAVNISKNASPGVLLSDPEWLGRPSQELQALRHRCLRHLSRLRRPVPLIQAIKEAQEKSSTGPARRTFADE